jgi:spermidine synthase
MTPAARTGEPPGGVNGLRFALLLACFFLSGFAALIYQTAWTRQFAFVFGTSELAVATVLAAYMGGLAAGAVVAARLVSRVRRPVLVYGVLELGIALAALCVPAALGAATGLYVALFGGSSDPADAGGLVAALFYLVSSGAILLVPTGLMGATLPLLARHAVRRESEIGSRVGLLYAINTVGAVAGAVGAGFLLLPRLGLLATIHVGVAVNGLVFLAAALVARGAAPPAASPMSRSAAAPVAGRWILPLVLISGAVSFGYEVLWSRLLGHLLGGSVYGFATMLASFLAGIAIGSAVASRFASSPVRAARGFALAQLGTAWLSLLAFFAQDRMPELSRAIAAQTGARVAADAAVAAATLLPAALCLGATFPLAVRVLARQEAEAAAASARVLAWNTLGAVAGAIGAGFFLVPALGYSGVIAIGFTANLALAAASAAARPRSRRLIALVAVAAVGLALLPPAPPWNLLRTSPLSGDSAIGDVTWYGVGRSATVLLLAQNGAWRLRTNGLPEARITPRGAHFGGADIARWLSALPCLSRPETRSMLVVGLGGGVVLEAVPSTVESIDVVELEPEVIRANQSISALRQRDPLSDPRVRLIANDARGALLLTRKRYDAIVSQPSHPWTAGASHLFTREFFALAREHLALGGTFAQWMGLGFADEPLLRTLVATLLEVFPHVRVYQPASGGVLFLGSLQPLGTRADALRAIGSAPSDYARLGIVLPDDVTLTAVLDERGARNFAAGAPLNTDDRNLLQMRSPAVARATQASSRAAQYDFARDDPLLRPTPGADRVYMVRRLLARGFTKRAQRGAEATADPGARAAALGLVASFLGKTEAARGALERALELDPGSKEARAALLRLHRRDVVARGAPESTPLVDPTDSESALIDAWRAAAARRWADVASLDPQLGRLAPAEPLYPDAVRMRVWWRLASGTPLHAREAVSLADRLVPISGSLDDRVLRARAAAAAGEHGGALSDLYEIATRMRPLPSNRPLARKALSVVDMMPGDSIRPEERSRLRSLLRGVIRSPAPRRR